MCDTYIIHVWCFRCITDVINTPVVYVQTQLIHIFHTCNTGVYPTHVHDVLHVYNYMCITCVEPHV